MTANDLQAARERVMTAKQPEHFFRAYDPNGFKEQSFHQQYAVDVEALADAYCELLALDQLYAEKLRKIDTDPEEAHMLADADLRELLLKLGFTQTVAAYDAIKPKWYA